MNTYKKLRWAVTAIAHHAFLKIERLIGIPIMWFYKERGIVRADVQLHENDSRNIAIIAAYPTTDSMYLLSLENLLEGLTSNSYKVIFVSNCLVPTKVGRLLSEYGCGIVLRKNIGRDFGAYQAGLFFVKKKLDFQNINRILLVNDTLIWFNDSSKIVSKSHEDDWNCLYFNLEYKSHAQSFYMSFSKEVISSRSFAKFWNSYIPLNSRIHAISYGEQQLTTKLLEAGFTCMPYIDSKIFNSAIEISNQELNVLLELEIIDLVKWNGVPSVSSYSSNLARDIEKSWDNKQPDESDRLSRSHLVRSVLSSIESYIFSDGPHRVGLHLSILFGVPLKADMYKCYNIMDLRKCLTICNSEFVDIGTDFFLAKSQNYKSGSSKTIRLRNLGEI